MVLIFGYLLLGLVAGVLSGLVGIGGGILLVPALVFCFGFSQHAAQGTTLALMVPPISILAAWTYYKGGYVDIPVTIYVCLGFVLGGLVGAKFATAMDADVLKRIFGGVLMLISLKMLLGR